VSNFEVSEPILNSPFAEPALHWYIREGQSPQKRDGRRPGIIFPPRDQRHEWDLSDGTLTRSHDYAGYELALVNLLRERVKAWRAAGYPGATRTTQDLLAWWNRDGRKQPLFFAQREAAETVILLAEARGDFRQGIEVPREPVSDRQAAEGFTGFTRYACKMATGSGKTTVMAMVAAWSILNKVHSRGSDARFSDVVLAVCPNVTIRNRLAELDPRLGEASVYFTRDLVHPDLRPDLTQGTVLVTNWHEFNRKATQIGGESSRVNKTGKREERRERIQIGPKTTTARGKRYLSLDDYQRQAATGMLTVVSEDREPDGSLKSVLVLTERYVESDTAFVNRVLGREVGGKQNILILNDEAHHAYRIRRDEAEEDEDELFGEDDVAEEYFQEATVWIDGLDRINKLRGINFCVDLSATPYFLGRVGQDTNRPFPWVVSDFGLIEAIESGLTKIPQLAVRDTTGSEIPGYLNIWEWILPKLTPAERGGGSRNPKPEAVLKYANHPIAMLAGLWQERLVEQAEGDDTRPPVFILVCKNTRLAKVLYEWIAENNPPLGIPKLRVPEFANTEVQVYTIRVDSKVVAETDDLEGGKDEEKRWMRATLDTVGKLDWPKDRQGRPIYPDGFAELAAKLNRPLHPPGRDIRCIVSVGMLTEGWDCNTVTHIVGLRPFMSQLLCEQVVGRGLRRMNYELTAEGKFTEEVAKVFGVPFEVIPFKQSPTSGQPKVKNKHVHPLPERAALEIKFPRVEGYTQAVRSRVVVDWDNVPSLVLVPDKIPPEVDMKGLTVNDQGRMSLNGPNRIDNVSLAEFRSKRRIQELTFELAATLTRDYHAQGNCEAPVHILFPQLAKIVQRYIDEKVKRVAPAEKIDLFLSPYYGWVIEILRESIRPDTGAGELPEIPRYEANREPGSTADVDYWTRKDVREIINSHLNYVVADTDRWEQSAAYYIDTHPDVAAFAKNAGLGFSIPYLYNGQPHDYVPDFLIRLKTDGNWTLILETKGYDERKEIKKAAAERWVSAVNADGTFGQWSYRMVGNPSEVRDAVTEVFGIARDHLIPSQFANYLTSQLGDGRWTDIGSYLGTYIAHPTQREIDFSDLSVLADQAGFEFNEIHRAIEALSCPGYGPLQRLFIRQQGASVSEVPWEEVAAKVRSHYVERNLSTDDWLRWANEIRVVWRLQK
jgi:type III restriction enzyme